MLFWLAEMTVNSDKKLVYIYKDEGADSFFVSSLYQELARELKNSSVGIRFIDAKQIITKDDWQSKAAALVFPGGRDLPYAEKLKGIGNQKIKDYVKNGGSYLGFCAGAYYACDKIEYDNGKEKLIMAEMELGFFKGIAKGVVIGAEETKDDNFPASAIKVKLDNNETGSVYYQEGAFFVADKEDKQTSQELGGYVMQNGETKPAMVLTKIGKGRALLCGFHPEVSSKSFLKGFREYYPKEKVPLTLVKALAKNEAIRRRIFTKIITASQIKTNQNVINAVKAKTY